VGHPAPEARAVGPAGLGEDRRHRHVGQAARDRLGERRQVGVDVHREAVRRHPALDVHADRGDLARADPHAGEVAALVRPGAGVDALLGQRAHHRALERPHVREDVVDREDPVADELARPVVGQLAAAVDVDDVEVGPRRELAGGGAPPAGVDRVVLEQQERVLDRAVLAGGAQPVLQGERLAVGEAAEVAHPEVSGHGPSVPPPPRRTAASARRRRTRATGRAGPAPG
jgi:hypothetical protein